jgi:deoxyhypusine synthase
MALIEKLETLSPELRHMITLEEREYTPYSNTPITNWLVDRKRHCNGGRTVDAGLWLQKHCNSGGKIFMSMAGAGSSFQMGRDISEMIRAGKIAALSVTGANLEESLYRLLSPEDYAYIPNYEQLTRQQEKELDDAGLRRITDTFLPEEETVRQVLEHFETLWREAEATGKSFFWHEYFFQLFERNLVLFAKADVEHCWLYQAWKHNIPVFVPGIEDSTMGNIFTYYCYDGNHPFCSKYKQEKPINKKVVKHSFEYMHALVDWYMDKTKDKGLAFLQYGGGIAADFSICVPPHLKKDFLADLTNEEQEKLIRPWAGFVEIHLAPMSAGSYSGAGYKEKITWGKFDVDAFGIQIYGDYTSIGPDICAIVLGK